MNKKKILLILVLVASSLLMLQTVFAPEQPSYMSDDGTIDFSKTDDIVGAVNSGDLSVDDVLDANPTDAQLEGVFLDVSMSKQSEIIGKKFGNDMAVNGKISSFKNGVITTDKVSSFDLKQHSGFTGKITVNEDGTISMASKNKGEDVKLGDKTVHLGMKSNIQIQNDKGDLKGRGIIEYNGIKVESGKEFSVFLDSEDHTSAINYVQFDDTAKKMNINADNIRVDVSKEAAYDQVDVLGGTDITLVNGGMTLWYAYDNMLQRNRIVQRVPFGMPVKELVVNDVPGGDIFYMNEKSSNLGSVKMSDFLQGGTANQIGVDLDVKGYNRMVMRGKELELPNGVKVNALEIQLWTSVNDKMAKGMAEMANKVRIMVDNDIEQGTISLTKKEELNQDLDKLVDFFHSNEKYKINKKKYTIGSSNIIVREDGKVLYVPREGVKTGAWTLVGGEQLGTPNPNLEGPSLEISPYIIEKLYNKIESYKNEDGTPKIPILD